MIAIKKCYAELVSLTQLYLLKEHELKELKIVDPLIFAFFQKRMNRSSPPIPLKKNQQPVILSHSSPTQISSNSKHAPAARLPEPEPTPRKLESSVSSSPSKPIPTKPVSPEKPPDIDQKKLDKAQADSKKFVFDPLDAPPIKNDLEIWKIFPTLFPNCVLSDKIPNDTLAIKIKNAWLSEQTIPPVMILSFQDDERQLSFLKNIAQAISLRLAPARVFSAAQLEKEQAWEKILEPSTMRLVIASDYELYLQPALMRIYRESPHEGKHFLNEIPLLLLSDPALYLKQPSLKSLLWRAICNEFAAAKR